MARPASRRRPGLRIAFVHPDLGLGGAERLIVDAATELAERGHDVTIYTAHHDPARAFKETVGGPFAVRVAGAWFPRTLGGRAVALCAYVRCVLAALRLAWDSWRAPTPVDAVVADQVSAVVPFLHATMRAPVLFYCHFPDQLLATRGGGGGGGGGSAVTRALRAAASTLRSLYRTPLDALEQATTGAADCLFVNSAFTARVFASTFPRVAAARPPPRVLYPAAAIPSDADLAAAARTAAAVLPPAVVALTEGGRPLFVSINRFERKKGLPLALRALAELKATRKGADPLPALVFAGGYDVRLPENVAVLDELKTEARSLGVAAAVAYLPSFSDPQRAALLALATAVVYTPQNEHFGIVPVEAGAAGVPVVACDSGGPTESILHGQTGFLCAPTPAAFAAALAGLAEDEGAVRRVGAAARGRVRAQFSRGAFGDALEGAVVDLVRKGRGRW